MCYNCYLPDADIHVVAAREDIGAIAAEARGKNALHALGVVHLTAVATIVGKDAHRSASRVAVL